MHAKVTISVHLFSYSCVCNDYCASLNIYIYYDTYNEHYYNSLVLGMFERVGMMYLK